MLARDWDIRSTDELNAALDGLFTGGGQNEEFMELMALLGTIKADRRNVFIESRKKDPQVFAKLTLVDRSLYRLHKGGIFAWDCGRYVMLCRWGAMIGLHSDEQAWERIMRIAGHVQPLFSDWYAYAVSYVTGRHFWMGTLSVDHVTRMTAYVQQLFTGDAAPWSVPWDTHLSL